MKYYKIKIERKKINENISTCNQNYAQILYLVYDLISNIKHIEEKINYKFNKI